MVYFLVLTASDFRVYVFLDASIVHDFREPWAFPFRRRGPPHGVARHLPPVLLSSHRPFRFCWPIRSYNFPRILHKRPFVWYNTEYVF